MSEDIKEQSNIITFLPPLIFNKNFIESFIKQRPPCAALGIVETKGQKKGFLAVKTEKSLCNSTVQNGFDLGSQLLGKTDFVMLHLVLNFDPDNIYDILLDLNTAVTKRVLKLWKKTGDYFFFVFNDGGGLVAFSQNINRAWYDDNYFSMIENAKNTTSRYNKAVEAFKKSNMRHGIYLNWVFQNHVEFLDLKDHRFEVKSSYRR